MHFPRPFCRFFFFNDTATTEIYTLSLHDALPISLLRARAEHTMHAPVLPRPTDEAMVAGTQYRGAASRRHARGILRRVHFRNAEHAGRCDMAGETSAFV